EKVTSAASTETISWSHSIAILPFKDLSPEGDQEYLCESMVGSLITKLRILSPDLKVISKRAVLKYKDRDVDISEIAKELAIDSILEGSLQIEGDRIRMNAWLTNTADKSVIWPFEYEGKFESVLDVQDRITVEIAKELKLHFAKDDVDILKESEPKSVDAYVFYAKGTYYESLYERDRREEDFATAVNMYEKTIELDPNFALAYWGLGNLYESRYVIEDRHQDLENMFRNYQGAYNIAPDIAECNAGMGWFYFYKRNNEKAYYHYKKAFEIKPNDPLICYHVGGFLRSIGLYRSAIKYYDRAIELDPLETTFLNLRASCFRYVGEYEKAKADLEEMEKMDPSNLNTRLLHARLLVWMGLYDEAKGIIGEVEQIDPDYPVIRYPKSLLYAAKKESDKALGYIEGKHSYAFHYLISNVYASLGKNKESIQCIHDGIKNGFEEIKTYLYTYEYLINNPFFSELKEEPGFHEILQQAKTEYEERKSKYRDL
ncbi:MAG: tetratricopeptide repeat protein, partial [Candidatus Aminicenantes bacterium]